MVRKSDTGAAADAATSTTKHTRATRAAGPCRSRISFDVSRRPANALNVEIGTPLPRCISKTPAHWRGMSGIRWLASGGDALVFGPCDGDCPGGALT